ncbi:MAG: FtsQ-type POTRA domain-containing protein [Tumebacillaceae bacterium]
MHETPPTIAETYTGKNQSGERKRRPNWKALLFVVIFFVLVMLAGFLQSPLSAVSSIEVKGIHQVRYEDVLRTAKIEKGVSFWKIDKTDAAQAILEAFPLVQSADVQVSWTGEVVIAVVEKGISGTLVTPEGFYRLLQDGTALKAEDKGEADNVPLISMDNLPAVEAGKKVASSDLIELVKQIPEVERGVLDQISEIRVTSEGAWKVFMRDKFEVRIPPRQFADKMKGYAKYRDGLGKDAQPGVIDLQSNFFKSYSNNNQPK